VALLAAHPGTGARRSSTARGTGACSSSASRASARRPTGCARYHEINDFEEQLTDAGRDRREVLARDHAEEQLRRFKLREKTAYKRFKITDEDWRNRKKWPAYERAVGDMVDARRPSPALEGRRLRRQAVLAHRGARGTVRAARRA
jgi:hypothetical protein